MFKRITGIFIALLILSILILTLYWDSVPGTALFSDTPVTTPYRMAQDFSGKWNSYSSLREAWNSENRAQEAHLHFLPASKTDNVIIPSNSGIEVIAKKFSVTGKWSYKTAQLVVEGVYGNADIYLNGMDDVHFIGKIEGNGGVYTLNFSPSRFDFSNTNILLIKVSKSSMDYSKAFGWLWPEKGKITGKVHLQAVCETTIDVSQIAINYDPMKKQMAATVTIGHHDLLEQGPWALRGELFSKGQKIAACTLPLNTNGKEEQTAKLLFTVLNGHYWTAKDPFLYEINLELTNNRGEFDSVQLPIGMRDSKDIQVDGEIISQVQAYQISHERKIDAYLQSLKNSGKNTVYFMGFFPNESWLYAADKLGVNVWLELPANMAAGTKLPQPAQFKELIALAAKHPSVFAWTTAKGLEDSLETTGYLQKIAGTLAGFSTYHLVLINSPDITTEVTPIVLTPDGLSGDWGSLNYLADNGASNGTNKGNANVRAERVAVILWLVWLIFVSIQNFLSFRWKYRELANDIPKMSVRKAFFWCAMALVSRMATLAIFVTLLIQRLPVSIPPWVPYDLSMLTMIQAIPSVAVAFFLTFLLVCLRLLQTGVAAPAFPDNPDALGLACWIERKYGWNLLFGIAIILMVYGLPFYIPIAVYLVLSLIFLPARIRSAWITGGSYFPLLVVPGTILLALLILCAWHYPDFVYLYKVILPNIALPFH
ncbi:beta-galactosidase [Dehalobacter sp. DCM]|uniref:beta-galactosidase n=1 Tax=Dehalobacter sp. DCM TaxID=2907827 RepID=UPI003081220B|nr:beta-galactosidase [Dehalobacter sp. DCM]